MPGGVEAQAVWWRQDTFEAIPEPEFGDVRLARINFPRFRHELLRERPAPMFVDDRYLIVAHPVDMIFLEKKSGIIGEETLHILVPESEDRPAGVLLVEKIQTDVSIATRCLIKKP